LNANRVRIIGGAYRSRILRFPARPGLRPTPDRVRETLFNWLGQDLAGRECLDLFAGSGALGFEAVSRGAAKVVLVENDREAWQALKTNAAALGCERAVEVVRADALEFVRDAARLFDIVFVDPPFGSGLLERVLPALPAVTRAGGLVYVESERGAQLGAAPWRLHRQARAGHVTYQLFSHGDQ
jgi:16S rRNA (guanine(966)-N(2))-methyltransferase RsmD